MELNYVQLTHPLLTLKRHTQHTQPLPTSNTLHRWIENTKLSLMINNECLHVYEVYLIQAPATPMSNWDFLNNLDYLVTLTYHPVVKSFILFNIWLKLWAVGKQFYWLRVLDNDLIKTQAHTCTHSASAKTWETVHMKGAPHQRSQIGLGWGNWSNQPPTV